MPMYFFNMRNAETIVDVDGTELPDDEAARAHAKAVARELMSGSGGILGKEWSNWAMAVHNNAGKELFLFPFLEARGDGANEN